MDRKVFCMQQHEMTIAQLAQEREARMSNRDQELERFRKGKPLEQPSSSSSGDGGSDSVQFAPSSPPKPRKRLEASLPDYERPMRETFPPDPSTSWQGGMTEVTEILANRVVQIALAALAICLVVVILLMIFNPTLSG
jgi:hypothetical protein